MHVVHVIRDLDLTSGGPSRSVPALAQAMASTDSDVSVSLLYQTRGNPTTVDDWDSESVETYGVATSMGYRQLRRQLARIHAGKPVDLIHLHGLWSPTLHAVARMARRRNIPYVISPRGMLSPWCLASKPIRKWIGWWWYQRGDIEAASFVHATSDAEKTDCLHRGIKSSIRIVANGCRIAPDDFTPLPKDFPVADGKMMAVAIARIDLVKGFESLIDAWAQAAPPTWQLVIAGPGSVSYIDELESRIAEVEASDRIHMMRGLSETEKWSVLKAAELSINASHSENFGMAIAESLAVGTPVIATDGTPWKILQTARCGWWVPVGVDGLRGAISEAVDLTVGQRARLGLRGQQLIQEHFAWPKIAGEMLDHYRDVLNS